MTQSETPPPSKPSELLLKIILILSLIAFISLLGWRWVDQAKPKPGEIAWRTNFSAALAESKSSGKPLLVDFSAEWCGPCEAMETNVWPNKAVARVIGEKYVPVAMDVETKEGTKWANKYGVETLPTILVLDGEGKAMKPAGGPMDVKELLEFLEGK